MSDGLQNLERGRPAVLLLGFGGPESLDEVRPFILNVVRGRNVSAERIETVVDQYRQIGGKSPFNELTFRQAEALRKSLADEMPVYTGMLYWKPYIADTLNQMQADGIRQAIAVVMAPHRSEASFDRYYKAVQTTLEASLAVHNGKTIQVQYVDQWHLHPQFIDAIVDRIRSGWRTDESNSTKTKVIFTAHSIPCDMSDRSGYAAQLFDTARGVMEKLTQSSGFAVDWTIAYQSRSGSPSQPWLEPDIQNEIESCSTNGFSRAIVFPLGFVCDHVEVLFDLDVLARRAAESAAVEMIRIPTVGEHPAFIELLALLVKEKAEALYVKPERK